IRARTVTGVQTCALPIYGVQNRFADWSLGRVFGDLRGFIEAAQWQQFRALKYEIESLRRMPPIAGYVITELTDAHWECNGLLDKIGRASWREREEMRAGE